MIAGAITVWPDPFLAIVAASAVAGTIAAVVRVGSPRSPRSCSSWCSGSWMGDVAELDRLQAHQRDPGGHRSGSFAAVHGYWSS